MLFIVKAYISFQNSKFEVLRNYIIKAFLILMGKSLRLILFLSIISNSNQSALNLVTVASSRVVFSTYDLAIILNSMHSSFLIEIDYVLILRLTCNAKILSAFAKPFHVCTCQSRYI